MRRRILLLSRPVRVLVLQSARRFRLATATQSRWATSAASGMFLFSAKAIWLASPIWLELATSLFCSESQLDWKICARAMVKASSILISESASLLGESLMASADRRRCEHRAPARRPISTASRKD